MSASTFEFENCIQSLADDFQTFMDCNCPGLPDMTGNIIENMKRAGEDIYSFGGVEAMRSATLAVYRLTGERYSTGAYFNQLWNGIGTWRA